MADGLTLLAAASILLVPGAALSRALGMTRTLAWTAGPALTVLLTALLTTGLAAVGIPWRPVTALLGAVLVIAVVAAVRRLAVPRSAQPVPEPIGRLDLVVLGVAALVLGVRGTVAIFAMGDLGRINNAFDAFFHSAAIAFIRDTGDGSLLTGSAPLYSGVPQPYPLAFDAIAALVPGDPVTAANATMLVLVPIGVLGTAGLVRALLPDDHRGPAGIAPILAGASTLLVFRSPDALGAGLGLWPNLLSVMLLPSAVMVLVHAAADLRELRAAGRGTPWRRLAPAGIHLCLVTAGVIVAHPSAFFLLLAGVLALALAVILRSFAGAGSPRSSVLAAAVLVVGGTFFVLANVGLRGMDVTPPPTGGVTGLIADTLADRPRLAIVPREILFAAPWWVLSAVGAAWSARRRSIAGLTASAAVVLLVSIIVLGSSSRPVLGDLTNAWYGAPERVMPGVAAAVAVLVALAVHGVLGARRRTVRLLALAVAGAATAGALVVTILPTRLPLMAGMFDDPSGDRYLPYVSVEEQEFIETAAQGLPENAVVLGDPWDGTSAFWTVGEVDVVYPTLAAPGVLDTRRVGERGNQYPRSDEVCGSLERLGVTHLYRDFSEASGGVIARSRPKDPFLGVRKIPTEHLDVVAQEGPYALYEVALPC